MRREEKIVEGRKTGIDFLSYENYKENFSSESGVFQERRKQPGIRNQEVQTWKINFT